MQNPLPLKWKLVLWFGMTVVIAELLPIGIVACVAPADAVASSVWSYMGQSTTVLIASGIWVSCLADVALDWYLIRARLREVYEQLGHNHRIHAAFFLCVTCCGAVVITLGLLACAASGLDGDVKNVSPPVMVFLTYMLFSVGVLVLATVVKWYQWSQS